MRIAMAAALFLAAVPAWAAGKIYYGSRVGMQVTVTSMEGIGTNYAVIRANHAREDARAFCVEYSNDKSETCVDTELRDTLLSDQIKANCSTGNFTTFYGDRLRFVGPSKSKDEFAPKYTIVRKGEPLDGSEASGYPYDLSQFKALCPNRDIQSE